MNKVNLTLATSGYDHFRDFRLGEVEGIAGKMVAPEDLFPAGIMVTVKV